MARARGVSTTAGQIEGLTASLRLYHQTRGDEHGRHLITDPDIGPKITWISAGGHSAQSALAYNQQVGVQDPPRTPQRPP